MLDYKQAHEEEERHRAMTIKSSKAPETKKVTGSDNIFGNNSVPSFGVDVTKKKATGSKKEKTAEEILVPDLVLTVRPLRKA